MAEFSKLIITKKGQALIAKILTGEYTVEFTRIASSDNSYKLEQLEELTALENIKQSSVISSITKTNEIAIKAEASFTNTDITEGYYMRTLGLYSVDPEEGEVLYAVTVETSGNCYMPPYNGVTVSGAYIQLVTSVGNAENVSLEIDPAAIATIGNIQELKTKMAEQFALHEVRFTKIENHAAAKDNPHQVTREQIGLGEVDNTNDLSKPVSTATQEAIEEVSSSNKQYVDEKVAKLINGAPEALDTLLELANAFNTNQELVETLTDAIGKKANQTDLTSHQNNTTLHISAAERSKWNTVDASLSATSTNPIQNKVVKAALDQQNVKNSGFESSIGELNSNLSNLNLAWKKLGEAVGKKNISLPEKYVEIRVLLITQYSTNPYNMGGIIFVPDDFANGMTFRGGYPNNSDANDTRFYLISIRSNGITLYEARKGNGEDLSASTKIVAWYR